MDSIDRYIIGNSEQTEKMKDLINVILDVDCNIIIIGESGVGKTLIAQIIHHTSNWKNNVLLEVNCATIPTELLEKELFGYEENVFSDGYKLTKGKFELAENGTILLDEIGEASLSIQEKILRVIQERKFKRLGSERVVRSNCRIISTSKGDLPELVKGGLLREDLYYRLNVIPIHIPPLRDRPDDIKPLFLDFLSRFSRNIEDDENKFIDEGVFDFLYKYSWPGNVRELKDVVTQYLLIGDWEVIKSELIERERQNSRSHLSIINKYIEFPPDLYLSGVTILDYFGSVLRKKYSGVDVRVRIEQQGFIIKMVIEMPGGIKEEIEQTLQAYGMVIKGETSPDDFFDNKADVIELKQQLSIAKLQLDTQKEILALKNGEIVKANRRIDYLEEKYTRLQEMFDKTLTSSYQLETRWQQLIDKMRAENNKIVEQALDNLRKAFEKGISISDETYIKEALSIIQKENIGIFKHAVDIIKSSISGVSGNLVYNWLIPFITAMPK